MKKLVFLGACLMALASSPVKAQTGGADIIVVRVEETRSHVNLMVERAGQDPEGIRFDYDRRSGKDGRASKGYLDALSKFYEQGYVIQTVIPGAMNASGSPLDATYSTLILTKGK